jgi:NAD(P)-dependent dehydrogenase (short-subunit alcohol dehydrogenase family)
MLDLGGRTVVITGGNGGIGLGIARGVARAGARVAIWARNEEKTAAAVSELAGVGGLAAGFRCDVSQEASVAAALEATVERFGAIHAGFANAGFASVCDPLKMSLEEWRRILAVNLDGAFLTLRDLARHMVAEGQGGKLVAVSSMVEHFGSPMQPHYAASKGGLGALVRSLAVRLARYDIQVNSLEPGWIETEATAPALGHERLRRAVERRTPLGRWGKVSDLEGIAVYLASEESRFHTGDSIRVDGGYTVF